MSRYRRAFLRVHMEVSSNCLDLDETNAPAITKYWLSGIRTRACLKATLFQCCQSSWISSWINAPKSTPNEPIVPIDGVCFRLRLSHQPLGLFLAICATNHNRPSYIEVVKYTQPDPTKGPMRGLYLTAIAARMFGHITLEILTNTTLCTAAIFLERCLTHASHC